MTEDTAHTSLRLFARLAQRDKCGGRWPPRAVEALNGGLRQLRGVLSGRYPPKLETAAETIGDNGFLSLRRTDTLDVSTEGEKSDD